MLLILIANLGCSLVILQVIILHAEGQSTLIHAQDILSSILLVGTQSGTIELQATILSHLQLEGEELVHGLSRLKGFQLTHHGLQTLLLATDRVHSQFVEVREFLLGSTLSIGIVEQLGEDTVDTLVVVLGQTVERTEAREGCRQRIILHPATTGILIEIISRAYRCVEVAQIDTRLQFGLCRCSERH